MIFRTVCVCDSEGRSIQQFKMNEFVLRLRVTQEAANACLRSILPEIESDIHGRSTCELKIVEGGLVLRITATDLHAMRAAVNTYVRALDMCLKLAK